MKVLLLNGSPHEKGCTYTALEEIRRTLETDGVEAEILWLGNGATIGCTGCGACGKLGKCVHDDVVNVAAEKMAGCDGLIVGSPGPLCRRLGPCDLRPGPAVLLRGPDHGL